MSNGDIRKPTNLDKWKYTLITTMILIVIMSNFVNNIIEKIVNTKDNTALYIIKLLIFTIILRLVMG